MGKRLYGCLQNRLEEDRMFCDKIEVGTGVTEWDEENEVVTECDDYKEEGE